MTVQTLVREHEALTIRRAVTGDLPAINRLMHASRAYDGAWRPMLDGYFVTADQVERDLVFVAEANGELLGFYSLLRREPAELDLLFVDDRAQGSGLGRRLFEHMTGLARARGSRSVIVVSHPPSAGFYERMGGRRIDTRSPRPPVDWERPILEFELD